MSAQAAQQTSNSMPQLDFATYPSQLFWLVVTFAILYYVMARHIVPRIHMVLENRQQRLDYDLDRASSLKVEAENARDSYERALVDARTNAQEMLSEMTESIKHMSDEKNTDLEAVLSNKVAESERMINEARMTAEKDLEPTAVEVAVTIIEKLSGKKADSRKVSKLISSYTNDNHKRVKEAS